MFIRSQAKFKVHFPKNLGGREPIKKMYRDGDLGSVRQLFGKPASPVRVSVEGLTIFLILIGALGRQQAMVQYSDSGQPCGRPRRISLLLALIWPVPGCYGHLEQE